MRFEELTRRRRDDSLNATLNAGTHQNSMNMHVGVSTCNFLQGEILGEISV